jgi:hypothetical protein
MVGDPKIEPRKSWMNAKGTPIIGPQTVEIVGFIKKPSRQCQHPLSQDHNTDMLPIPILITSTHVVIASAALQMTFIYQLR